MKHTTSRQLYGYWDRVRGERAAPRLGDIDPGAIRHILADTFILEPDAGGRARFRSAGTRCCALFARPLRSTAFAELWARHGTADLKRMLDTVMHDTLGVAAGVDAVTEDGGAAQLELLLLPLRSEAKRPAGVIGALVPTFPLDWIGTRPITCLETVSMRVMRPAGATVVPMRPVEAHAARRYRFVVYQGGLA